MSRLVEKKDKDQEEKELYDAFTEIGAYPELNDAEFAFQAQAEVALHA